MTAGPEIAKPTTRAGWAVVGLGELALGEILPAFGGCTRSSCRALVSGDRDKALRVAAAHGVEPRSILGYDDFDRLRDLDGVDVVYLVLPNSLHCDFAVRALEAGKHVFCEKPMATSAAECERMVAAARMAGRELAIAYRLHHEPRNRRFAELCRNGALGRIATIESSNVQVTRPPNIRLSRELGGGPVQDIGIYSINACRMVTGEEPATVQATAHHPPGDPAFREVPESVAFVLRYPSGTIAHCVASFGGAESRRIRAHGEHGWAELDPAFAYRGLRLRVMRTGGERGQAAIEEVVVDEVNQFAAEMDAFSASVLDGAPVTTPGELGLADLRIVEAIERAIASGGTERVNPAASVQSRRGSDAPLQRGASRVLASPPRRVHSPRVFNTKRESSDMATKKGLLEQAKDAIVGVFESKPASKSATRTAAGKKAARTRKMGEAVTAVKTTAKKAATKTVGAAKKAGTAVRNASKKAMPAKKAARTTARTTAKTTAKTAARKAASKSTATTSAPRKSAKKASARKTAARKSA